MTPSASEGNQLPRDAAGHFDLNEGTSGIIAMSSCDGVLEVYKQDLTYRIQTPGTIDLDRNPGRPGAFTFHVFRVHLQAMHAAQAPTAEMAVTPPSIRKSAPTTYAESSDAR